MPIRWEVVKIAIVGAAIVHTIRKTYYNVEGGHRAVEFSRLTGTKNKVKFDFSCFSCSRIFKVLFEIELCHSILYMYVHILSSMRLPVTYLQTFRSL